jgi:hypothetical protein
MERLKGIVMETNGGETSVLPLSVILLWEQHDAKTHI